MKISDILTGVLVGILGVAVFLYARTLPLMPGQEVGPGMFPQLISIGFIICSVLLVARGLAGGVGRRGPWITLPAALHEPRNLLSFLLVPAALIFYTWFSDSLGFIPVSVLLLMTLCVAFGTRWRTALMVSIIGTLCIHYLFYKILEVPLPWGLLEGIAW